MNIPLSKYLSKVKYIYLELKNYTYFHGPSDIGQVDDRFIGRERLIKKLKSLLTNSESKSGAYLVTGYRGMGKSSFVYKVLSDINSYKFPMLHLGRFLRILLPLFFLASIEFFDHYPDYKILMIWLPCILFILSLVYWYFINEYRSDLNKKKCNIKKIILFTFIIKFDNISRNRFRVIIQDYIVISIIQILSLIILFWCKENLDLYKAYSFRIAIYLLPYLVLIIVNICWVLLSENEIITNKLSEKLSIKKILKKLKKTIISFYKIFLKPLFQHIKNYVKYSNQIHIKINLGYDDLKEIDILRLVARNIYILYRKKIKGFSLPLVSWKIISLVITYIILCHIYYYSDLIKFNDEFKYKLGLIEIFPTQDPTYLNRVSSILTYIKKEKAEKKADFVDSLIKNSYAKLEKEKYIHNFIINLDLQIQVIYIKILRNLPFFKEIFGFLLKPYFDFSYIKFSDRFTIIPIYLDYLFILYFFIVWFGMKYVTSFPIFGIATQGSILKRMKELNELIDAQTTQENYRSTGISSKFNLKSSKRYLKQYPRADVREIEKHLFEILEDIHSIPRLTIKPEFILIFDELDKIEPHQDKTLLNHEDKDELTAIKEETLYTLEGVRSRQQNILKLLSNLKHFITTAQAKFIFIAGREMYDAALADVSDRNFFIGSIFNDVIYVDSFLKDADMSFTDITTMTEYYVCQHLLPKDYSKENCTLKNYNKYLKNEYLKNIDKDGIDDYDRYLIIYTLQNFITYLTYRSNGAPKKITANFEQYVMRIQKERLKNKHDSIRVGTNSKNLYLGFGFYDLYQFGMSAYIFNPFVFNLSKIFKDYGDKLLVSSAFIADHIYKYHSVGFEWRNLELIPEILDINKAPQLREVIKTILNSLLYTSIHQIDNGLYDFKFNKKISEEITFLSKIKEKEAAAFNFTLDESLAIKQHYRRKLYELEKTYSQYFHGGFRPEFIRAKSFIKMILGDLHFFDEEYDNAIIEYMEALQLFGNDRMIETDPGFFVLFVRNTLKLALTFEKKKTYDSAFVTYNRLINRILNFKDVKKEDVDIVEIQQNQSIHEITINNINDYVNSKPYNSLKFNLDFRFSLIERMRLFYQPLLAAFNLLEKSTLNGISEKDIIRINKQKAFFLDELSNYSKNEKINNLFIKIEFNDRMSDILFFKNGLLEEDTYICKDSICCKNNIRYDILTNGYSLPCRACELYIDNLKKIAEVYLLISFEENDKIKTLLNGLFRCIYVDSNSNKETNNWVINLLANTLSDLGNTFLSCCTKNDTLDDDFIEMYFELINCNKTDKIDKYSVIEGFLFNSCSKKINKLNECLIYYYLSAIYYRRSDNYKEYSFQLTKILYVLQHYIAVFGKKELGGIILNCIGEKKSKSIITKIRKGIDKAYAGSRMVENMKMNGTFKIFNETKAEAEKYTEYTKRNNSLSWDIDEMYMLQDYFEFVKIKRSDSEKCVQQKIKSLTELYKKYTETKLVNLNSLYNRMLKLEFKVSLNFYVFKQIKNEKDDVKFIFINDNVNVKEIIWFLIIDSIFCLNEIIRDFTVFGYSYNFNYSYLANIHKKMGDWCKIYEEYKENDKNIEDYFIYVIKKVYINTIDPKYHYELSLQHFRNAIETHRQGKAYRTMIEDMVYLNDDYNDNLFHFSASLERYKINTEIIKEKIDDVKKELNSLKGQENKES